MNELRSQVKELAKRIEKLGGTASDILSNDSSSRLDDAKEAWHSAADSLKQTASTAKDKMLEKRDAADSYVRSEPWTAIAIAAAVGAAAGMLIGVLGKNNERR